MILLHRIRTREGPHRAAWEKGVGCAAGLWAVLRRSTKWMFHGFVSIFLNLVVVKPIAIFVWWLSARSNYTTFHARAELASLVKQARREGTAILFVSNHLSMFDDPIIPMALFRTGLRASAELLGLAALLTLGRVVPATIIEPGAFACVIVAFLIGIGLRGARKTWCSLVTKPTSVGFLRCARRWSPAAERSYPCR